MNDLEELQGRVEGAVKNLQRSQIKRREYNQSLGQILNDLESKFEARTAELDHCRQRIALLEDSNSMLTGLVGQLVDIVERIANETDEDPVFRATGTASDLVDRYVRGVDGAAAEPAPLAEEAQRAADGHHDVLAPPVEAPRLSISPQDAFRAASASFEDVSSEALAAETDAEAARGATEFPRLVYDAIARAGGGAPASADGDAGGFALEAEEPIEIPEHAPAARTSADADDDQELDIKEIMARLEIAAERAQLRGHAAPERSETGRPDMGQAVGGSA